MRDKGNRLSIFLSLLLRHKPEAIGLELNGQGYLNVDELIEGINKSGKFTISKELLDEIIEADDKKRYEYSSDRLWVRACQGHSVDVDLGLKRVVPKCRLYHGTASKLRGVVEQDGLKKMKRQYVHLTDNIDTAVKVGSRHGNPIVYEIDVDGFIQDGGEFWLSANNVWLSKDIPSRYLIYRG